MSESLRKAVASSGMLNQDLADILLDAEAKLGEMLAGIPDFHSSGPQPKSNKDIFTIRVVEILPAKNKQGNHEKKTVTSRHRQERVPENPYRWR